MDNFFIDKGEMTPFISFDAEKNHFEIRGESMPESPPAFYKPVIQWLENYFEQTKNSPKEITIDFKMDYFNSASSNSILDVLKVFEKAMHKGFKINIRWYYDQRDSDIKESGEEFKRALKINSFELVILH